MKDNFLDFIEDVKDRLADFEPIQIITAVVGLVCAIGLVIGVMGIRSSNAEFETKSQANDTEIMRLKSELSALTNENNQQAGAGEVEVVLKSANTAGVAVAGLQTAYQDCVVNVNGAEAVEKGLQENAAALDVYFDDDSKGARVPWFQVTGGNHARLIWSFMTNYTFTDASVECLWTCRDGADNLVAFAIGTYTASTNLFSDVKYYATAYGNKNYRTPDDPVPVYSINLDDGSQAVLIQPENVLLPEGYAFDADGVLRDADGNPYMGDEGWASDFENQFKNSKEYREYMLSKGAA